MKKYRVDSFINGNHTSMSFDRKDQALAYGRKQNERGEITFLLRKLPNSNTYDVIDIIQ